MMTQLMLDVEPWVEEKESFLKKGFGLLKEMISKEELVVLGKIYDQCFASENEENFKALGGIDEQGRQSLPQVLAPSRLFPELKDLKVYERCRQAAAYILGHEEIHQFGEHMILKPANHGVETPWHQDQAYHDPSKSYRNINFWFPLDGAREEEGCLHFVEGSHAGSTVLPHTYLIEGDSQSAMVAQDQKYWSLNGTAVPCPKGACTLHHSYSLHYAGPNKTARPRRAYVVVFGEKPVAREKPWVFPWQKGSG